MLNTVWAEGVIYITPGLTVNKTSHCTQKLIKCDSGVIKAAEFFSKNI